ncbi:MAG: TVP38/TMEM64 family protein [Planctomycetes bacterium]|nr:TVP38/TMEM64 family protein [Planctomycetota bacterium]
MTDHKPTPDPSPVRPASMPSSTPNESTTRRNAAFALAFVWVTMPPLIGFKLLANIGAVGEWLKEDPSRGIPAYILIFAISSGLGILPTYAQAILGGWVFGLALGAPAAIAGCVGGALLGWCFSRLVSGRGIEAWLDAKPKAHAIRSALVGTHQLRLMWLVALLRLPPNSPFAIANLAMASTGVRLLPFIAGTAIGMMPRTIAAAGIAAAGAATGADDIQALIKDQGWLWFGIGIVALVAAFAVISQVAKRALKQAGLDTGL